MYVSKHPYYIHLRSTEIPLIVLLVMCVKRYIVKVLERGLDINATNLQTGLAADSRLIVHNDIH